MNIMDKVTMSMNNPKCNLVIEDKWILTSVRQEKIDLRISDGGPVKPTLTFASRKNKEHFIHVCLAPGKYVLIHEGPGKGGDIEFIKMSCIPLSVFKYFMQLQVPENRIIN